MGKAFSTFMALIAVYVWTLQMGDFLQESSGSGAVGILIYMAGIMFLGAVTDFLHAIYVDTYRTSAGRLKLLIGLAALSLIMGIVGAFFMPVGLNPFWVSILGILVFVVIQIGTDKLWISASAYRAPIGRTRGRSARRGQ
ncbi:hypothetical protein [Corynebacterium stationis]|uniref:hypothetical protein n=1 Tax=Corynebacterium stationis TaxID=1705 RepID=UPI0025B751BD|nr:hypothetical protein [Corynebacterium stationis]